MYCPLHHFELHLPRVHCAPSGPSAVRFHSALSKLQKAPNLTASPHRQLLYRVYPATEISPPCNPRPLRGNRHLAVFLGSRLSMYVEAFNATEVSWPTQNSVSDYASGNAALGIECS